MLGHLRRLLLFPRFSFHSNATTTMALAPAPVQRSAAQPHIERETSVSRPSIDRSIDGRDTEVSRSMWGCAALRCTGAGASAIVVVAFE
mmetsp:Transcript_137614/g.348726  ORF Transcript_137614/g.348726 Transcript_137614/m.348726 type:complete len:89 (+) Transcript_137614:814-1080(+)